MKKWYAVSQAKYDPHYFVVEIDGDDKDVVQERVCTLVQWEIISS